jgi:hypothetical protein
MAEDLAWLDGGQIYWQYFGGSGGVTPTGGAKF